MKHLNFLFPQLLFSLEEVLVGGDFLGQKASQDESTKNLYSFGGSPTDASCKACILIVCWFPICEMKETS